jgi:hypothetical protein
MQVEAQAEMLLDPQARVLVEVQAEPILAMVVVVQEMSQAVVAAQELLLWLIQILSLRLL